MGAEGAVRAYLLAEHADLVATVLDCADAVAAGWEGSGSETGAGRPRAATTDRDAVVPPLRVALERAGVLDRLPAVLAGCVAAAGRDLPAEPVAAPPYVIVTSRGPVARATLADDQSGEGTRLVVTIRAFEVERGADTRYVRGPRDPDEAIAVEFRDGSG